eukprot:1700682-Ditylum_brightwellii.AAC.1
MKSISNSFSGEEECNIVHESHYIRIFHMLDPQNKFGGRTGSIVVKSLIEDFPDDTQALRLRNEYAISKHLSQCIGVRECITKVEQNGIPSLILEWATGVTLGEWIKSLHKQGRSPPLTVNANSTLICKRDIKLIMKVATVILKAVSYLHDAGVVHNNLSPANIIINENDDKENISTKVIGLGSAILLADSEND